MAEISTNEKKLILTSQDDCFAIRKADWNRIKRMISRLRNQSKLFSNTMSIAFSVGVTLLVTVPTLPKDATLKPVFLTAGTIFLGLGATFFYLSKKTQRHEKVEVEEVVEEMNEIEKAFKK